MLNLDQIKQLETKVAKAIHLIQSLKEENDSLKLELNTRQQRIEELENIVLVFKNDQAKIEEGIINALNHLSAFEDTVYQAATSTAALSAEQSPTSASTEIAGEPSSAPAPDSVANQPADSADHSADTDQAAVQENAHNADQMEIF